MSLATNCAAQNVTDEQLDRVYFAPDVRGVPDQTWEPRQRGSLAGRIRKFDSDELALQKQDGQSTRINSERVVRVDIQWANDAAREAMELVEQRKYAEAISPLDQAIKSGIPQWQQRFLIAGLIESADGLNKPRTAGILFLNLAASRPPALLYSAIPLCWTVREPDRVLLGEAKKWLASDDEVAQLLGSSWLLFSPMNDQAAKVLLELESAKNQTVASLAVSQRWRLVPPPETMDRVREWMDYRDQLIEPLQLGPTEFLADRLARVNEPELALGQWMRIASVHGQRYHRTSAAIDAAITILKRRGNEKEAQRLMEWANTADN